MTKQASAARLTAEQLRQECLKKDGGGDDNWICVDCVTAGLSTLLAHVETLQQQLTTKVSRCQQAEQKALRLQQEQARLERLNPRQPVSDEESRALLQTTDGSKWANAAPPSREAAIAALATTVRYPLECAASYDANGETVGIRLHARDAQKALTALSSLLAQLQQAQQQRDAALAALKQYGQHPLACLSVDMGETGIVSTGLPCDCGLDAALHPDTGRAKEQ